MKHFRLYLVTIFPLVYGLSKGDFAMANSINAAIRELTHDGTIMKIFNQYEMKEAFLLPAKPYREPQ